MDVLALSADPQASGGRPRPDSLPDSLPVQIAERWLDDQPIVYIGKAGGPGTATTVTGRLTQFYRHRWGKRSPHRGGQDVLLLDCPLWVFAAPATEPRVEEKAMIAAFKMRVGHRPFANRANRACRQDDSFAELRSSASISASEKPK